MLKESIDYITQLQTKSDVDLTWDQINVTIDAILSDEMLRRRRNNLPRIGDVRIERSKESVEILPHGARRIKMNWNSAE